MATRNRTTKVTLIAQVSGYISGMEAAAKKTRELASEQDKLAAKRQAFEDLGRPLIALGTIAVATAAIAVARFAKFDAAMSNVKAVTQETTANMHLLRDAALEAGGATVFTATEAANAIEELGKAGLSTADILDGGLNAALGLAASGQLEVARAAEITATTMKQFGLDGTQAARVADVLSAGAGKALGSVEDLAQGLKFVGPVAASMGISLEDTTAALALFADQGIIGEQAGTSLRGVLSSLTSPSSLAAKEIERLGINLYDTNGRFLGVENTAGQLAGAFQGLTDAQRDASLGILFGNQQVTAARVLFQGGAEAVRSYTEQVNDAGYAARVAADRLDNLSGDLEKLGGAFDTTITRSGSSANETLRDMVQTATFLVEGVAALPAPVYGAASAIAVVTGALALSGGAAALAVPRYVAAKEALQTLGITGRTAAVGIGAATLALSAATFVIAALANDAAERANTVDSFGQSLDRTTGQITNYTRELIAQRLQAEGAIDVGQRLGLTVEELVDQTLAGRNAIGKWADARRAANADDAAAITQYDTVAGALEVVSGQLEMGREQWRLNQAATESARAATAENESTLASLQGQASATSDEISGLADTIRGFGSATLDVRDAQRQFQAAIDDTAQSIAANGVTLDTNTEAGRANEAALDGIARSALSLAAATVEQTGSQVAANDVIKAGRDELVQALAQFGITGDAAQSYADALGLIPESITTAAQLTGVAQAQQMLDNFLRTNDGRVLRVNIGYRPPTGQPMLFSENGNFISAGLVQAFANGGFPSGIYSGRPGGIHKFAEPNVPWEAYVSGKPGQEPRNRAILSEAANRLGMTQPSASAAYGTSSQTTHITIAPNVNVNVNAGMVTDRVTVAREVTEAIKSAINSGDVSPLWNG